MADPASSSRRRTRTTQISLTLAEEQALAALSCAEQRDVAAALRLSLQESWDSEDEQSSSDSEVELDISSSVEVKQSAPSFPADDDDSWSSNLHDIDLPLSRLRPQHRQQDYADTSAFALLQLFLPLALMEEFAHHTNAAAPHDWRRTTAAELYAFLGVHLYMGICRLPRTRMYWNETFSQRTVSQLFSRDRFRQLLSFFRIVAPEDAAAQRNPLPHVRALATRLNESFAQHYTPVQHLALDEAMVAYKGRSSIKQYIPSKPHKWGYKIWCLSSDDYLLHFEIYAGKEGGPSDAGATIDTALRMTAAYHEQQYVLYTDSWFTSPALLHALAKKGVRLCGAVRSNRRGMPAIPESDIRALGRGKWLQRQRGDTTVAVWQDQKALRVLYNHCSPSENATLSRWNDRGEKVSVDCPRAVRDYFFHARCVDVLSQLHYAYAPGRKARRCWPRLAWWLLDMCVINAYKLWSVGHGHTSQLQFREKLMHELLQQLPPEQAPRKRGASLRPVHALANKHYSIRVDEERDCAYCSNRSTQRVRTVYLCAECQAHLCVGTCFAQYHS